MVENARYLPFVLFCLRLAGVTSTMPTNDSLNLRRHNQLQRISNSNEITPFVELIREEDRDEVLLTKSSKLVKLYNARNSIEFEYSVIALAYGKYILPGIELDSLESDHGHVRTFTLDFNFPGNYDIFVYEKKRNAKQRHPTSNQGGGEKLVLIEPSPINVDILWDDNVETSLNIGDRDMWSVPRPPCQSITSHSELETDLRGYWLGPDAPSGALRNTEVVTSEFEGNTRAGWSFYPKQCSLETFTSAELSAYSSNNVQSPTSIAVLGTIVERGVFFSLLDLALDQQEKENIDFPNVGKNCLGRTSVQKGGLNFHYQTMHTDLLLPDEEENHMGVTCYDDKIVPNATQSIQSLFAEQEDKWPQVILMFSGCNVEFDPSSTDNSCLAVVHELISSLPRSWNGTLYLNDMGLHGLTPVMTKQQYAGYHRVLKARNQQLHRYDARIRWIDSVGISTSMKQYHGKTGTMYGSNHLHHFCNDNTDSKYNTRVCSSVTEALAQLLLGRALAPTGKSQWHPPPIKAVTNANVVTLTNTGMEETNDDAKTTIPSLSSACPVDCMGRDPIGYMRRDDYNDASVAVRTCRMVETHILHQNHLRRNI